METDSCCNFLDMSDDKINIFLFSVMGRLVHAAVVVAVGFDSPQQRSASSGTPPTGST